MKRSLRLGTITIVFLFALCQFALSGTAQAGIPAYSVVLPNQTQVEVKGIIKVDSIFDAGPPGGDRTTFFAIPLEGSGEGARQGSFRIHARQTGISLQAAVPGPAGELRLYTEGDFYGETGDELTNSNTFRFRQAYGAAGPFLAGQTWTTFSDEATFPETIDPRGPTGIVFVRQAQLRYTIREGRWQGALALENPESDYSDAAGQLGKANLDRVPDLAARIGFLSPNLRLSVHGLLRELRVVSGSSFKASCVGRAGGVSGLLKLGEDDLRFQLSAGTGIGRYIADATGEGAFVTAGATPLLEAAYAAGGFVSFRHFWGPGLRSSFIVGQTSVQVPELASTAANQRIRSAIVNLFWSPHPAVDLGLGYVYAERRTVAGAAGELQRVQFSTRLAF